jgi:NIMA (never in mitosis gene a)-related kinase 1/4/5
MWALGCIIYKMCCGRVPFSSPKRQKTIDLIREGSHDPIPEIYSEEIRDLVNALLNTNADLRPSIDELFSIPWVQEVSEKLNAVTLSKKLEERKL